MRLSRYRLLATTAVVAALASACSGTTSTTTVTAGPTSSSGSPPAAECSATGVDPVTEERTNLTEQAEAMRLALIDAARECDFDALAAFASEGSESFGSNGGSDVAAAWIEGEQLGEEPMRNLVILLRGTMGTVAVGTIEYRFPSAAGFESWADVPENLRTRLEPMYSRDDWADFEAAGIYDGHRTTIADSGEWLSYFVDR